MSFERENTISNRDIARFIGDCPSCKTSFIDEDSLTTSFEGRLFVVHVECGACASSVIARIEPMELGIKVEGIVTDVSSSDEADRFIEKDGIEIDDVLEIHGILRDDTLFSRLFPQV